MQQDNINTIEREAIMVVTKEIDRKLYWKDIKRLHLCEKGNLYSVYENGTEKGIFKCIQETERLIIFGCPDKRYSWKKCVIDKRDVATGRVIIKSV